MDCTVGQPHPEGMAMKSRSTVLAFTTAALTCAMVWAASPWFTGRREPWDADSSFYLSSLLIAGAVTGALTPRPIWALYLGAIAGQLSYQLLFLKVGPLLPLGVLFLVGYSLIFLLTAALVGYIRIRIRAL